MSGEGRLNGTLPDSSATPDAQRPCRISPPSARSSPVPACPKPGSTRKGLTGTSCARPRPGPRPGEGGDPARRRSALRAWWVDGLGHSGRSIQRLAPTDDLGRVAGRPDVGDNDRYLTRPRSAAPHDAMQVTVPGNNVGKLC